MQSRGWPEGAGPILLAVLAVLSGVLVVVGLGAPGADAQSLSELKQERERVARERAQAAASIDALKAEQSQVVAALDAIQADVDLQEARLADARAAADLARRDVEQSQERERALAERSSEVQEQLASIGVNAYVGGETPDGASGDSAVGSPTDIAARRAYFDLVVGDTEDLGEELRAIRIDAAAVSIEREEASDRADDLRNQIDGQLDEVTEARDRQAQFAADVSARLDNRLAEAAVLADNDSELAQQITQAEAAVAARLAAQRRQSASSSGGGGGSASVSVVGSGDIRTVGGIQIHVSMADNLQGLLNASRADGISLGGWGYRSSQRQIQLRRQNCGSSSYAIYQMSSSRCRPPTARPGRSNHERGLAVDFTCSGGSISSRGNRCYQWLAANAARFGFYNLPSEPWHWSINGN